MSSCALYSKQLRREATTSRVPYESLRKLMAAWLAGWQNNLQQLQQPRQAIPTKKHTKRQPSSAAQPLPLRPNATAANNHDSNEALEEMTVPFDGAHLLECHGMTQYDTELQLEKFLQQLAWTSVAPAVRYDFAKVMLCSLLPSCLSLLPSAVQWLQHDC